MPTKSQTKKSVRTSDKNSARAAQGVRSSAPRKSATAQPIWETIIALGAQIPEEELSLMPRDASINHDHYLYGVPRENE